MARILHVEDEPEWIEITKRALADHRVDSASNYREALDLICGKAPYDLALVDLNLECDDDGLGGEILDILRLDYPATLRIVVTARPPSGSVRANIFERYGAEEILIKGKLALPDLRRAVAEALSSEHVDLPQTVRIRKSELVQRYMDWRDRLEQQVQTSIFKAEEYVENVRRIHGQAMAEAQAKLAGWRALKERLKTECAQLEATFNGIHSMEEALSAMGKLEQAESRFADEIRAESNRLSGADGHN
jgi:CheY-like chemotaxis protein